MSETEFRQTVAANISKYRKNAGLTQLQLADMLNYSDKAVSKWERGESLPDAYMLFSLAKVFGITLNDLASADSKRVADYSPQKSKKHLLITAMSIALVWLGVSVAFFVLKVIGITLFNPALLFLYAIPISFIVGIVFTCIWWKIPARAVAVSGLIWSLAFSIFLSAKIDTTAYIFLPAAILQILTGLWFGFRKHQSNRSAE